MVAGLSFLLVPRAHAATLNVVAGNDGIDANGQCQLSEAFQNINDQAQTNLDCAAGDGNNDTINLPSGTITLTANSFLENGFNTLFSDALGGIPRAVGADASFTINGESAENSVISGDDFYFLVGSGVGNSIKLQNFTLTHTSKLGFASQNIHALETNNFVIDGQGMCINFGIFPFNTSPIDSSLIIHNTTIKNIECSGAENSALGISFGANDGGITTAEISNTTISALHSADNSAVGVNYAGIVNATYSNITIHDIYGNLNSFGITGSIINQSDTDVHANISYNNMTIGNVHSFLTEFAPVGYPFPLKNAGISVVGAVVGQGSLTINQNIGNSIVYDAKFDQQKLSCSFMNINQEYNIPGSTQITTASLGGNISDDDTCSSSFTQPTDKNNVNPADLKLGTLGDYGGSVPTIPLGEGSIAIDAGVPVNGLTTDSRGVARPQCAAFDSGAYEYNGTCPAPPAPVVLTHPEPNSSKTVTLVLPSDVTNPTVSAIDPKPLPKDSAGSYPAGLTTFQFTTTPGATKTVTLYYDLPGNPSDYTARKYKTDSKTYLDVPNATITREDYNGKSMLKLTYNITDGGILDQDGQANGTVIDPVGLATTKLADTGENTLAYLGAMLTLITAGLWMGRRVVVR